MRMITVTFFIQDAKAKSAKLLFRSDLDTCFPLATPEQALDAAIFYYQEIAKRLDLIINGRIANISITLDCPLPNEIKAGALSNSDVEEGALMLWDGAVQNSHFRNTIPTFNQVHFGNDQEMSSPLPTLVADYCRLVGESYNEPILEDVGFITDNRGEIITGLPKKILKSFKKSVK